MQIQPMTKHPPIPASGPAWWAPQAWAQQTFGQAQLGDPRRTKRLVRLAGSMAREPEASLPRQHEGDWGQTKAAYRFLGNEAISAQQISEPVWQQTRAQARDRQIVLLVHDDTEIDLGYESATQGLGPVGNGSHCGFLVHSVLAIDPQAQQQESILGIAFQESSKREPAPRQANGRKQTHAQRQKRERESQRWWQAIEALGEAPAESCWVEVGDRYADMWNFFATSRQFKHEVLVRACHNRRLLSQADETVDYLLDHARRLPVQGQREIAVPSEHERRARTARLRISWGPVQIEPTDGKGHVQRSQPPLEAWVVRVWEPEPPLKVGALRARGQKRTHGPRGKKKGQDPSAQQQSERIEALEWVLISSLPVHSEQEAWRCVQWYGSRWTIEELHKVIKTGCRVEERHLGTLHGHQTLLAVVTPIAVRLLQLRQVQEQDPQAPAESWVGTLACQVVATQLQLSGEPMTIHTFLRGVAKLGGFLGRKSDGDPGWLTLWRGWQTLQLLLHGVHLADGLTCG